MRNNPYLVSWASIYVAIVSQQIPAPFDFYNLQQTVTHAIKCPVGQGVSLSFNFSVLRLCKHTVEGQTRIITQTGRRASDFTYISPLIDTGLNLKPRGNTIHV